MCHRCVTSAWHYIHAIYPQQRLSYVVLTWKIHLWPFNLFCGWTRGDITVSSTFFWSKLWWSYNDYSQSSLAYLECQKLNDSTKGKTKHYLLWGIFFFDYIARSLVWKSWPNVFLVLIHFHPGHLKPKLRHWSGPILIKTEQ